MQSRIRSRELASDSEEEKKIRKAQERALRMRKRKQNAAKTFDKEKGSTGSSRTCSTNDRPPFRGIVFALSLNFQHRQMVQTLPAFIGLCCVLCFSILEKEMIFLPTKKVRKTENVFSFGSLL